MNNSNLFSLGSHPINLALRFILEVTVFFAVSFWGFGNFESSYSYIMGIGTPILMASLWGIFAVPDDPSRSGKTLIKTPGMLRLILEILFFLFGAFTLYSLDYTYLFYMYSAAVVLHHLLSIDRIKWLLNQ